MQDKVGRKQKIKGSERGVALVIAIFTLMLITVVATALILMSQTQTAIKTNYKSSMQAFYDAKAGLEEGRSRLWSGNASPLNSCVFPTPGSPMPTNYVCYIVNPDPSISETVDPTNQNNPYFDSEYQSEFPGTTPTVQPLVNSSSPVASANIAGPLYKWVRITPVTEQSAGIDVDGDGIQNTALFYNGRIYDSGYGSTSGTAQVLSVTALAVTPKPNPSQRLVQSNVTQSILGTMNFPSTVTLDGNGVSFALSGGASINGNDSASSPPSPGIAAIGYTNSGDASSIPSGSYQSPTGVPSVQNVGSPSPQLPPAFQTPGDLNALVQTITQGADVVITPPAGTVADQRSLPAMWAANPLVVVVNGDFHLTHSSGGSFTGYGMLLVTGTLYYDPDDSWYGTILVIGKGVFDGTQNGHNGLINGTVLVANTRDSSGNLLTSLGAATFKLTGGGNGVRYASNWVKAAQARLPYQVLSFREIQQPQP